jgi:hypothetical protein
VWDVVTYADATMLRFGVALGIYDHAGLRKFLELEMEMEAKEKEEKPQHINLFCSAIRSGDFG